MILPIYQGGFLVQEILMKNFVLEIRVDGAALSNDSQCYRECHLGRKLLMSSLIKCSSVLRTFVDNQWKPLCYDRGDSIEVFHS